MSTSPEMDALVTRLEKLERQNRRWRRGAAVALLAGISLVLMAQAKGGSSPKVVQAAVSSWSTRRARSSPPWTAGTRRRR